MDKLDMQTKDLAREKLERIAELFPGVITEAEDEEGNITRAVDFDLLRQELSTQVVEGGKERYQLTWPGKREAIALTNMPINKTLRPAKEESADWDTTENVYIEGDNLEALKILQESYLNSVKCIYIDPPYNTGNNFIYQDDFKQDIEEYKADSGQVDEEGNRLFANNESNGRFHSDWLSMMYPRLKLARNLLREDGVIFISIDNHEVHNLRKICDSIFGENNLVTQLVWQKRKGGGNDSFFIAIDHEYVLIYCKNKISQNKKWRVPYEEEYLKRYKEKDEKGRFYWDTLSRGGLQSPIVYDIECPDGSIIKNGTWQVSKQTFLEKMKNGEISFAKNKKGNWTVFHKIRQPKGKVFRSVYSDVTNTDSSKEIQEIFDLNVFDNPKPVKLLKDLISLSEESNEIILDFFAGSATTAHAVMQLNAEDDGNRKYIMVQLPEPCEENSEAYKAGYENISEIGKERIRRAANKIKEETGADIDYGFRVFKVDSSNMKDVYYHPEEITQQQLHDMVSNIKEDRTSEDLLVQVMLEWDLELSLPMEKREIQGKEVHFVAGNSLVACFEEGVTEDLVKELAGEEPLRVVFRDSSFASDAERINVEELFKMLSPHTEIRVI